MLKTVVLHGSLAGCLPAEYGGRFSCVFATAREAASAIERNFGGFYDKIREMAVWVVVGNKKTSLDEDQVWRDTIDGDELHIYPAAEGAGGKGGIFKAIAGVFLIAVAVVLTGGAAIGMAGAFGTGATFAGAGTLASFALNMGIGLVLSSLVQPPPIPKTESEQTSSIYSGPLNTNQEGVPLPYAAGRSVLVGGVVVHTDLQVEIIK